MINTSRFLKNFFLWTVFIFSYTSANAGLNNFTNLIFVEEWLIERKINLNINETECRASIPSHASWFGARIRLGPNDELIKPNWISIEAEQLLDSKLDKVRDMLDDCRSGVLFLPDNL